MVGPRYGFVIDLLRSDDASKCAFQQCVNQQVSSRSTTVRHQAPPKQQFYRSPDFKVAIDA